MTHLKDLVIFVEGPDDETFFKKVILPELKNKYACEIQKYQNLDKPDVNKTVQGYLALNYDYMFVCDFDEARSTTAKTKEICDRYSSVDTRKVVVVKKVIEGW